MASSQNAQLNVNVTGDLPSWSTLASETWPTLLLGNGLSINLWDGFRYDSLLQQATLSTPAEAIFTEIVTTNFETVLECLHHARVVLKALSKSTRLVDQTYEEVRDALFDAVNQAHVKWSQFSPATFAALAAGTGEHRSVFTTNYDLCLYWSLLENQATVDAKDFFWNSPKTFNPADTSVFSQSTTLIYYLHGGLHLWQDDFTGEEGKWTSGTGNLLDLKSRYTPKSGRRPLFISEGTTKSKARTIQRSAYLSFCLERLAIDDSNTVIFGHGLTGQDQHIVDALNAGPKRKVAVALYPTGDAKAIVAEKGRIQKALSRHKVVFFDSTSHPIGDPSLHIT